ncbi:MAG: MBOAT family O-acyltransferase [Alloprevotella sp.]
MLFNSYDFLLFLPCVLLLYRLTARRLALQNLLLVVASYVFYAWWDVRFLSLIIGMTLVGYAGGRLIEHWHNNRRRAKVVFTACIALCLGLLGLFKYYGFFAENVNTLLGHFGLVPALPVWQIILPVGISFYTFQTLSYVADVYRQRLPACHDAVAYAAFVGFFPQLVAGPIEQASHLLPQMQSPRHAAYGDWVDGLRQMLWGFAKKMLLADRCAPIVQAVYGNPQSDGTDLLMATVLFAMQIYGDFSGYSDIAVGTARLFGIRLTRNFNVPYFSRNIADFWRRWHISLMQWFKEYVYIPLGGSRCSRTRQALNTFVVFTLSGLWHGAAWTFMAWGLFHACCFLPLIAKRRDRHAATAPPPDTDRWLPSWHEVWQMGTTFVLVCVGWVFFRSESLGAAFGRLLRMATDIRLHTPYGGFSALYPALFVLSVEWVMRHRQHGLDIKGTGCLSYRAVRWAVYYALIFAVCYGGGAQADFIYFQF